MVVGGRERGREGGREDIGRERGRDERERGRVGVRGEASKENESRQGVEGFKTICLHSSSLRSGPQPMCFKLLLKCKTFVFSRLLMSRP